jgi:hypothetical protein
MEYVFTLPESCSVAWGAHGVWLSAGEAWFADDPFVKAHPEMFSVVPPRVRSTEGRETTQVPLPSPVATSEFADTAKDDWSTAAPRPRGRRG